MSNHFAGHREAEYTAIEARTAPALRWLAENCDTADIVIDGLVFLEPDAADALLAAARADLIADKGGAE